MPNTPLGPGLQPGAPGLPPAKSGPVCMIASLSALGP